MLQNQYNRPLSAADLLLTNAYSELMTDVTEVKDLGSGVIGGNECDHLAFPRQGGRLADLDCPGQPPLSVQIRDHLQTGRWLSFLGYNPVSRLAIRQCAAVDGAFLFKAPPGAKQISLEELEIHEGYE